MDKSKYKIIYRYEHPVGSILADIFSFGVMLACFWLNKTYIDGNN